MATVSAPHPCIVTVFEASMADAERVTDLIESAYRGPGSKQGWTTEADLLDGQRTDLDAVRDALARDDVRLLIGTSGTSESDPLLGCCQIERRSAAAYFGSFAVRPDLQNAGLGRTLLAAAEMTAVREWQAEVMEMTVIAQRAELIAWYQRRGYRLTGETRPFPYDDARAGLPRREDLHFVVLEKRLAPAA
ncbi:MAG TPA: GNAT family N-acetyltransferase [Frankiaceae bacterium]|jgi:ribosomal protein S18 acetylase RimI-like enzyme|nr:GNAT family N-acetyltransferase [Frankiaceae bacterium]